MVGAYVEDSTATGVNGDQSDNSSSASGAAYVFARSVTTWSQQAYLKASNTGADDQFGYSVSVSGNTVVVAARNEDSNATGINGNQSDNSAISAGAAYVFLTSASVGGFVWNDLDRDGIQDAGEPGIGGVTVKLYSPGADGQIGGGDDALILTTESTEGTERGQYEFNNLASGSYFIEFTKPAEYEFALPDQGGNDSLDSDISPAGAASHVGLTPLFSLAAGEAKDNIDAGLFVTPVSELHPADSNGNYDIEDLELLTYAQVPAFIFRVWPDGYHWDAQNATWAQGNPSVVGAGARASSPAIRLMPAMYVPGGNLEISVTVNFAGNAEVNGYIITEHIPAGTTFSGVVSGGNSSQVFLQGGDVKISFPTDSSTRTVVYRLAVGTGVTGDLTFAGQIVYTYGLSGSATEPVGGTTVVAQAPTTHAADTNQDNDIGDLELLTYVQIPAYIFRVWPEGYHWDAEHNTWAAGKPTSAARSVNVGGGSIPRPEWRLEESPPGGASHIIGSDPDPVRSSSSASAFAARNLPDTYTPGTTLDVTVNVDFSANAETNGYIISETLPSGVSFAQVVSGGSSTQIFPQGNVVKISFPTDPSTRVVVYRVSIAGNVTGNLTFSGQISYTFGLSGSATEELSGETVVSPHVSTIATLTMAVSGNGMITPAVGDHTVNRNESLAITAQAATDWHFVNWTTVGGATVAAPNAATTTATLTANGTVTANFASNDSDGDGLLDSWEQQIVNANPNDAINTIGDVDPRYDFDGDGATNALEFAQGTDPTDIADKPFVVDVDGNGRVEALADGILVLRYTFGFRGEALIQGAIGQGCTRCDAPAIETYLDAMMP